MFRSPDQRVWGRKIIETISQASTIKSVGLELGGNAPMIIVDDADLEVAASAIVYGRFIHRRQIWMSTNRVLVDATVYDDIVAMIRPMIEALKMGDPSDPGTQIGPLINAYARDIVLAKIAATKATNATMLIGGEVEGNVIPPHLFVDCDPGL